MRITPTLHRWHREVREATGRGLVPAPGMVQACVEMRAVATVGGDQAMFRSAGAEDFRDRTRAGGTWAEALSRKVPG